MTTNKIFFVVTFILYVQRLMCTKPSILWQLMCITNINLPLVQNIFKIYASGVQFNFSHLVEHNDAIGFQNRGSTKIKYFLHRMLILKRHTYVEMLKRHTYVGQVARRKEGEGVARSPYAQLVALYPSPYCIYACENKASIFLDHRTAEVSFALFCFQHALGLFSDGVFKLCD